MRTVRVLVGCEESQAVTIELRKLGIEAFSCDIQPCSGGHPEWHYQQDIFEVFELGWDAMICFPPCTHLAVSGAAWFEQKRKDGRQQQGIDFFMAMVNAPIKHIAIENPIGIMSKIYRKPDQVIQPYYFGDEFQKTTCLWLKNVPKLFHNSAPNLFNEPITHVGKGEFFEWTDKKTGKQKRQPKWYADAFMYTKEIGKERSKTFPGIAKAMAKQWGEYFIKVKY
jgi:hypothetical protein